MDERCPVPSQMSTRTRSGQQRRAQECELNTKASSSPHASVQRDRETASPFELGDPRTGHHDVQIPPDKKCCTVQCPHRDTIAVRRRKHAMLTSERDPELALPRT